MIQRADQTAFDIQFYIYADNEVRKLPADSLKKVYKWNRQGRCYLSVSDLAEIYREFGLNAEETQSGNYFPYTVRGEKTLAQATVVTYKGQQYVSYNLDKQEATYQQTFIICQKEHLMAKKFRIIIQTRLSRIRTVSIRLQ